MGSREGARLGAVIVGVLFSFVELQGCVLGADGCNQLDEADQCSHGATRCNGAKLQSCMSGACGNYWLDMASPCEGQTPFCVKTSPARAECAPGPKCADTSVCQTDGTCTDASSGCVADAAGCAASCSASGLCAFDGTKCAATADGCASSTVCKTLGKCGASAGQCVPNAPGCAQSKDCAESQLCGFDGGVCVAK